MTEPLIKDTKYNILNIIFKVMVAVFIFLYIIFYFKIDITSFKLFSGGKLKDKKSEYKSHNVNRNLSSAISNSDYSNKKLPHFFIKTAYNCCQTGTLVKVDRLKTILSQGFRCLDFELEYKNNTVCIKQQISGENFYSAIKVIEQYAFSNSFCNNNEDPIILNLRIPPPSTSKEDEDRILLLYSKLRNIFQSVHSKYKLDDKYSLLHKFKKDDYKNVQEESISTLKQKIIVMCTMNVEESINTDYNDSIYNHEFLQYVHVNMNNLNAITFPFPENANIESSYIISTDTHNALTLDTTNTAQLVEYNNTKLNMITTGEINTDLSNFYDTFGYPFRAMDFSSVNFETEILDTNLNLYSSEFNRIGSAFILKPDYLRG